VVLSSEFTGRVELRAWGWVMGLLWGVPGRPELEKEIAEALDKMGVDYMFQGEEEDVMGEYYEDDSDECEEPKKEADGTGDFWLSKLNEELKPLGYKIIKIEQEVGDGEVVGGVAGDCGGAG